MHPESVLISLLHIEILLFLIGHNEFPKMIWKHWERETPSCSRRVLPDKAQSSLQTVQCFLKDDTLNISIIPSCLALNRLNRRADSRRKSTNGWASGFPFHFTIQMMMFFFLLQHTQNLKNGKTQRLFVSRYSAQMYALYRTPPHTHIVFLFLELSHNESFYTHL